MSHVAFDLPITSMQAVTTKLVSTFIAITMFADSAGADEVQAIAPEITKTVDAFAGTWRGTGDVVLPGKAPIPVSLTIDCAKTALGRAVACTYKGTTPLGPTEATLLIGYDELARTVHIMAATSDGEMHDHVCRWKAETITCDLFKGSMGPLPITEELAIDVQRKKLVIRTSMFTGGKPLSSMTWTWART